VNEAAASRRALWDPGWYNLDQSLKVGQRAELTFLDEDLAADRGYDLVFANTVGGRWHHRWATVEGIEHAWFGAVDEVDTSEFGQYTFRFADGRWVAIEAEQEPGGVNAASTGFPVDECDRAWADTSGWALAVTLFHLGGAQPHRP